MEEKIGLFEEKIRVFERKIIILSDIIKQYLELSEIKKKDKKIKIKSNQ